MGGVSRNLKLDACIQRLADGVGDESDEKMVDRASRFDLNPELASTAGSADTRLLLSAEAKRQEAASADDVDTAIALMMQAYDEEETAMNIKSKKKKGGEKGSRESKQTRISASNVYEFCEQKAKVRCRCQGAKGKPCAFVGKTGHAQEEDFDYYYDGKLVTTVHEPRGGITCGGSFKPINSRLKTILRSNLRRHLKKKGLLDQDS